MSGFANAVAGQGTAFTDEHVKMLKKVADQVALVYDDDGAGHKATIKSARLCLAAELPVRVVSLPGGDDPDSFLRTHPADEFRQMLDHAESIMAFQVRAERAKETNPNTVDAMNRIVREILLTISQCPNAVLRAGMVGEAAKLLNLPTAALNEELGKVKVEATARRPATPSPRLPSSVSSPDAGDFDPEEDFRPETEDGEGDYFDEGDFEGEEAAAVVPPPPKELALCEFLMANEYDKTLDGMVGEFLPDKAFAHDFTRQFVETWRMENAKGEDLMQDFAAKLDGHARAWFDEVLLNAGKTQASALKTTDILEDFVRALWADALKRERGGLPAAGDPEADLRRMKISMDLKRLSSVRWAMVKDMIRDWMQ